MTATLTVKKLHYDRETKVRRETGLRARDVRVALLSAAAHLGNSRQPDVVAFRFASVSLFRGPFTQACISVFPLAGNRQKSGQLKHTDIDYKTADAECINTKYISFPEDDGLKDRNESGSTRNHSSPLT